MARRSSLIVTGCLYLTCSGYMRTAVIRFGVTCPVKTTELGERYDDQGRSKACRRSRTSVAKADKALDAGSAEHLLCGDVQTAAIQIQKRTTGRHSEMGPRAGSLKNCAR